MAVFGDVWPSRAISSRSVAPVSGEHTRAVSQDAERSFPSAPTIVLGN